MGERIAFVHYDDGNEYDRTIAARYVVCDNCRGKGTTVNPSVDGHGLSREDLDEDPDFAEDYFAGVYDVTCPECNGLRVVLEVDRENADPVILAEYDRHEDLKWRDALERLREQRMGC